MAHFSKQFSETFIADEVDRLIQSATLRIEQHGIHIAEMSAAPLHDITGAKRERDLMIEGLQKLRAWRGKFAA